jgi:hypothetical protein
LERAHFLLPVRCAGRQDLDFSEYPGATYFIALPTANRVTMPR